MVTKLSTEMIERELSKRGRIKVARRYFGECVVLVSVGKARVIEVDGSGQVMEAVTLRGQQQPSVYPTPNF
jgi:hypothetical protein